MEKEFLQEDMQADSLKELDIWAKWPWYSTDADDNKTLYIKDGTKIICAKRIHFCNINKLLSDETIYAGQVKMTEPGEIILFNNIIIIASEDTIVSVEYESGKCTIRIGHAHATIKKPTGAEMTVPQGTVIDNQGNIIK